MEEGKTLSLFHRMQVYKSSMHCRDRHSFHDGNTLTDSQSQKVWTNVRLHEHWPGNCNHVKGQGRIYLHVSKGISLRKLNFY